MTKILLVEDNEAIVLGVTYLLLQEGFEVMAVGTMEQAKQAVRKGGFSLALLDITLPDGDGFDLCRLIKERADTPVIFLTAKEEEGDVVKGFDLGADDYVMKPFRNRELVSRIKSVLRRAIPDEEAKENELRCGTIRLNPETGAVFVGEEEINLTKLEFRILSSMMAHPGKIFTREEILAGVWDLYGNYVNDNTLSVTMKRIREKLGDVNGERIRTVRGIGYRLEK